MTTTRIFGNDPVLTSIFQGYMPGDAEYIHNQILPVIPVTQRTGDIPATVSTAQDFLRIQNTLTISDGGSPEITADFTKADAWSTQERSSKIRVTKTDGVNFAPNGQTWEAGMSRAREVKTMLLRTFRKTVKEYALANYVLDADNHASTNKVTLSGTDQFDSQNSDPKGVFKDIRTAIERYSNSDPDQLKAVIPYPIYEYMVMHNQLKVSNGIAPDGTVPIRDLTRKELAKALNVNDILVPRVKYETANLGQTSSLSRIWGNFILVFHVNPNPNPNIWERSFGYEFVLDAPEVDTYTDPAFKNVDFVRFTEEYDQLILNNTAAYLVTAPISSGNFV